MFTYYNKEMRVTILFFIKFIAATQYNKYSEAAIEGVQASVDALKLVFRGWCLKLKIEIVFGNI